MERVLLGYWRSSSSWRVRIALNWKGLPYGTVPVHPQRRRRTAPPRAPRRNPMGQVPVLLEEGIPLSQSMAILEYLEETHPDLLLPDHPRDRARVRQFAEVINSGIQPIRTFA